MCQEIYLGEGHPTLFEVVKHFFNSAIKKILKMHFYKEQLTIAYEFKSM